MMKTETRDGVAHLEFEALNAKDIQDAIETLRGYLAFVKTCSPKELRQRKTGFDDLRRIHELNHANFEWCSDCQSYHAPGIPGCFAEKE